jgi:hypothetical protein
MRGRNYFESLEAAAGAAGLPLEAGSLDFDSPDFDSLEDGALVPFVEDASFDAPSEEPSEELDELPLGDALDPFFLA